MKTTNAAQHEMIAVLLLGLASQGLFAQEQREPPRDRPARNEDARGASESLTAAQIAQVKKILSAYDANTLTADQAKAIHESFRQAGMAGGPAMNSAVTAAGFNPDKLRDLAPPPSANQSGNNRLQVQAGGERQEPAREGEVRQQAGNERQEPAEGKKGGPQQYSISQAISDEAQLHTIAFSGLAFVTGDYGADTFLPPGKACDFFGFQYMRDIDAAQKGHNPMFLDRVAGNVLLILNDSQRTLFATAARQEAVQLRTLAEKRLPLIKAFCRQLDGSIPAGSQGLNKAAVTKYVGDIFAFDAEISYKRAQVFGQLVVSFTPAQKAYLAKMKFGDFNTWPAVDMEQYKLPRQTEKMVNVAYMTYASEFFSWYAGSVDADVYFCPERHGTYFGGFFMKDMPAMNKRDFDISTSVTGDSGKEFLNTLTDEQRPAITAIPDLQRSALKEIIEVRRAISMELRLFLKGQQADLKKVIALGRRYGELDGELSYAYATGFAKVNRTLTSQQRATLIKLRNLPGYTSAPAYIYSDPVREEVKLPNTDHFFFPAK
jgi:Spy/CpxP family protein refolding chaperone